MPKLNPTANVLAGVAGVPSSIDLVQIPVPDVLGDAAWLTPTLAIMQAGTDATGTAGGAFRLGRHILCLRLGRTPARALGDLDADLTAAVLDDNGAARQDRALLPADTQA